MLGAYGLIGSACVAALKKRGANVTGVGRSKTSAQRCGLEIDWIIADITESSIGDWQDHLKHVDVVINASGVLQDGMRDNVHAVHDRAISTLCAAARDRTLKIVQISAAGVSPDAETAFFRSKALGDAVIAASTMEWVILRPTLVIGPNAYGGTALLRGVAGLPAIGVRVFEGSAIQTIAVQELAEAVAACAMGDVPMRRIYDLTETGVHRFDEAVGMIREWLGFSPHRMRIYLPLGLLKFGGFIADGLGWLGWRAPLRSTAIRTIEQGVTGDPSDWLNAGGREFSSLPDILKAFPATLQERWFARLYLMFPLAITFLSFFWIVSGTIGFWSFDDAVMVLTDRKVNHVFAQTIVLAGSAADIVLGMLVLVRPAARGACIGMLVLSLGYLAGATLFAPDLWLDPLGPLVKVLPSVGLALLVYGMLEER